MGAQWELSGSSSQLQVSQHELQVAASCRSRKRERVTKEGGQQKYESCDRWPGDVASVYAVITKNRINTVTIIGYHGMSQQCDSNKNSKPPTMAMDKYMRKKITCLKQQHPPCTPGTYKRSTTGFKKATWINNPI
jgi:hypothetical protein